MNSNGFRRWLQSDECQNQLRDIITAGGQVRHKITQYMLANTPPRHYPPKTRDGWTKAETLEPEPKTASMEITLDLV